MTREIKFGPADNALSLLKQNVEIVLGFNVKTPKDFARLSDLILKRQHTLVSPTTLKRIWGYLSETVQPRATTLDILARFIGHVDWCSFCQSVDKDPELQSNLVLSPTLSIKDLKLGQILTLRWLPDRECSVQYKGGRTFEVVEAFNTKLQVGDNFECCTFIENEPLYLDSLVHNGGKPVTYVVGKKDGIRIEY